MIYIPHPNFNFDNASQKIHLYSPPLVPGGGCGGYADLEHIDLSKLWLKFEKASPGRRYSIEKGPLDYRTNEFSFLSEDGCEFGIQPLPGSLYHGVVRTGIIGVLGSCSLNFKLAASDYLTYGNVWIPKPFVEFLEWLLPQVSNDLYASS